MRTAALFCNTFLPYSETFVYDEITHHRAWNVEVFCRARRNAERFPYDAVTVPGGKLATLAYRATTWAPAIAARLRAGGHRLLHAHFGTNAVFALPYALRLRRPLIVTYHGFDVGALVGTGRYRPGLWRYWALSPLILRKADLLLCASEELQEIVARLSGRPRATRLYRLGIDLDRFVRRARRGERPQVTMVGRFVEKKGHLDGIEAFARAGGDAHLTVVGDGPLAGEYRRRIVELRIGDRVTLTGPLPAARVAELLGETDVLVAPSKVARDGDRESGLLVVKEASACGAAVLGTRHGGIPEIIDDGVTGYLVAEGDVEALAGRLRELLGAPALRDRLGRAGRAKMEREYDLRARVAELERIYDEVAG